MQTHMCKTVIRNLVMCTQSFKKTGFCSRTLTANRAFLNPAARLRKPGLSFASKKIRLPQSAARQRQCRRTFARAKCKMLRCGRAGGGRWLGFSPPDNDLCKTRTSDNIWTRRSTAVPLHLLVCTACLLLCWGTKSLTFEAFFFFLSILLVPLNRGCTLKTQISETKRE